MVASRLLDCYRAQKRGGEEMKDSSFAKLLQMEATIIQELITKYSTCVLNGDISFERAIKKLHWDTGIDELLLEDQVIDEVQHLCPVYPGASL